MSSFVVALCQEGAERAVVDEAAAVGLVRAYSRPGLVTLKSERDLAPEDIGTFVFARHTGLSVPASAPMPAGAIEHVDGVVPKDGALVYTRVDDKIASLHVHEVGRSPWPQALMPMDALLPPEAPSRAWLKIEEAARTFRLDLIRGERALEIGSAPGGAAFNLLSRGIDVIGIDPNEMDARVLANPRFHHLHRASMGVKPPSIEPYQWLLLDVNVPPRTALKGALPFLEHRLAAGGHEPLRGFVLTLKMKSWAIAGEVPSWLALIERSAPGFHLEARQLSSNGQEICVVGVR